MAELIEAVRDRNYGAEETVLDEMVARTLWLARWRYRLQVVLWLYPAFWRRVAGPYYARLVARRDSLWGKLIGVAEEEKAAELPVEDAPLEDSCLMYLGRPVQYRDGRAVVWDEVNGLWGRVPDLDRPRPKNKT